MTMSQLGTAGETPSRAARERDFHDELTASHARAHLDRYYFGALTGLDRYEQTVASLARQMGSGARVLEYGCGSGSAAFDLADGGADVVGIDISPAAIDQAAAVARDRGLTSASFRVMDAHALDVPDTSFDVVCGTAILHHLDIDVALAEVARVLTPRGRAVFYEPLGHNPVLNLYRRATPSLRTEDERPLRWSDIERAERWFSTVDTSFFNLFALALAPIADRDLAHRVGPAFHRIDQAVFRRVPYLRRYAWTTLIQLADRRSR